MNMQNLNLVIEDLAIDLQEKNLTHELKDLKERIGLVWSSSDPWEWHLTQIEKNFADVLWSLSVKQLNSRFQKTDLPTTILD